MTLLLLVLYCCSMLSYRLFDRGLLTKVPFCYFPDSDYYLSVLGPPLARRSHHGDRGT